MYLWWDFASDVAPEETLENLVVVEAMIAVANKKLPQRSHCVVANKLAWKTHYHMQLEEEAMNSKILSFPQVDLEEDSLGKLNWGVPIVYWN